MRRLGVCHIITRLIVGGAQENTLLTCARLDRDRYDVTLISGPQTGPEGELHTDALRFGLEPIVEPTLVREVNPPKDAACLVRLVWHLRHIRPDIVHTHSSKAGVLGRLAARIAQVPMIVHTVHGWGFHDRSPAPARTLYVQLERWLAKRTNTIIVVTDRDRETGLREKIGVQEQYRIVRSGFDLQVFRRPSIDPCKIRLDLGIPESAKIVGTVGRLSPQKNPLSFLRIAARVLQAGHDAHFVMVGDGPLCAKVISLAEQLGLTRRLHLTGIRRDVPALLNAFDIFLLTSLWEGLPKVIPQAMAAGVPVVASGADGITEIVRNGQNGLTAPPGNDEALSAHVLELLANPQLASSLAEAAGEGVAEYDLQTMIDQLDELYSHLMRPL